jgi:6-phosphogluconolactonase
MKQVQSPLGEVHIGTQQALYETFVQLIRETVKATNYPPGVALTGGSSPKSFFEWLALHPDSLPELKKDIIFTVSDERHVPIESEDSNYGNALRLFFEPMGVEVDHRFPWDTNRSPEDAASWYAMLWELSFGTDNTYDLCMLGMGDDCHTASLFPGSPLLRSDWNQGLNFASVAVPGKGYRLTITPRGLSRCGKIVVMVTGADKAAALHRVFHGEDLKITEVPVALLGSFPEKVVWLIDEAAASQLSF